MPQPTTQRRWTEDTRVAFLLALRLTGNARAAAREIRRKSGTCYQVRRRDAVFAAAWDAAAAEGRARIRAAKAGESVWTVPDEDATGARDATGRVARWDGLTPLKRRGFLRALAETGEVKSACRRMRITQGAAHRMRQADPDFAAGWDRALATSGPLLEQVVWERAVEGWEEPVFRNGVQVGTRRRFSETLLRQLVIERGKAAAVANDPAALARRAKEAARAAGGWFGTPATRAETDAAILKALATHAQHRDRADLDAAEAAGLFDAARWVSRKPQPSAQAEAREARHGEAALRDGR